MYNHSFARHYDALSANVNYPARARYFRALLKKHSGRQVRTLMDLACGTGSLSWEFSRMGYEVIGVDASPEMLSRAITKGESFAGARPPLFLCQPMEALDLYGTVDDCVCALDSVNHLPDTSALEAVFGRVALFLAPGGVFLFDVNTRYKHKHILGANAFVYETDDVVCVWRNAYHEKNARVEVALDFFEPQGDGLYRRSAERFSERIFTHRRLRKVLKQAGLKLLAVYGDGTTGPPKKKTQRVVYVAKKL